MAWRIESNPVTGKGELVIDGFENGIADSPYLGIADMRNANITSSPKQASVQFGTSAITMPPTGYTAVAFTSDAVSNNFTVASTAGFYVGMGLTIVTVSGVGSGTAGTTYYVISFTSTTFKLAVNLGTDSALDVTVDRTGTFTVPTFGTPADSVSAKSNINSSTTGENIKSTFILTSDGLVWYISSSGALMNTLQFMGNLLHSSATPGLIYGITVFNDYLFAFMKQGIDYLHLDGIINSTGNPTAGWVYGWKTANATSTGHRAIVGTDDVLYFCNGQAVGSIIVVAGATFDPSNAATYTFTNSALALPAYDSATCLEQLGTNLLVGGILKYIYPWDRISTSFTYPIVCAENYTACMVTMNSSTYVFAGNRGRIYITNGSNIQEFKKFPDYLSGTVNPYYRWGWAIYWKDQLYFTISATDNASTAISNFAGLWAIDIEDTKALRLTNSLSYGTYAGTVPTIVPMGARLPTGDGIFACWANATNGIDYTLSTPYSDFNTRIDTDIIPVGTFLNQKNFTSLEFKLAKPLVSGEAVRLSWRPNLASDFTLIDTTTTAGAISDVYTPNFSNIQWLQLRAETKSIAETQALPLSQFSGSLSTNLVRYYKLDGDAVDSVGGFNGTTITDITYSTANGIILQGAGFNGTTSQILQSTSTTIPTNATLSCWINSSVIPVGKNPSIYGFRNAGAAPQMMFVHTNISGKVNLNCKDSAANEIQISSTNVVTDGEWHFLVGVKSGNTLYLYVDGVLNSQSTGNFTGTFTGTTMVMGATSASGPSPEFYGGALDECGYWTRALSATDVTELYNTLTPSYVPLLEMRLRA